MVKGFYPENLTNVLTLKKQNPEATLIAGGTDLMVTQKYGTKLIFLNQLPELQELIEESDNVQLGACCTYSTLIESHVTPELLKSAMREIASPSIRNMGTIGGNICNASPAGDTLVGLYALNARVRLARLGEDNSIIFRELPIKEFITGVRTISIDKDEILTSIIINKDQYDSKCRTYYKKVGSRNAQAIAKLSFAGVIKLKDDMVLDLKVAFGSVGPTVVRLEEIEERWINKSYLELTNNLDLIIKAYGDKLHPIDDQRSTAIYRKKVCLNLLKDFIEGK